VECGWRVYCISKKCENHPLCSSRRTFEEEEVKGPSVLVLELAGAGEPISRGHERISPFVSNGVVRCSLWQIPRGLN